MLSRSIILRLGQGFVALIIILLPHLAQAQGVQLINPLGSVTDPRVFIGNVIKGIMSIIGSISLFIFVYGGFLWITSFGDKDRIDRGKRAMTWAVLGLAVIAGAYVIVNALILGLTTGSVSSA